MSLLEEHDKYKAMGPSDVFKKEGEPAMAIQVSRSTSHTGEQFSFECPIWKDDTREDVKNRLYWALSIVQDRLEEENEAMIRIEAANQKTRLKQEAAKRNEKRYNQRLKDLKRAKIKESWTDEAHQTKVDEETAKYKESLSLLEAAETPMEIAQLIDKGESSEAQAAH